MSETIHEEPELRQKLLQLHKHMYDVLDATHRAVTLAITTNTATGMWGSDDAAATPAATEYKAFLTRYSDWSRQGMQAMEQTLQQLWNDGISLTEADESGGSSDGSNPPAGNSHIM